MLSATQLLTSCGNVGVHHLASYVRTGFHFPQILISTVLHRSRISHKPDLLTGMKAKLLCSEFQEYLSKLRKNHAADKKDMVLSYILMFCKKENQRQDMMGHFKVI